MSVNRLFAAALMCAATATPASADVTLQFKGRGQILGSDAQDATEYRKGRKVRTDSTSNGVPTSSIIDLDAGRMILLWHDSKRADVIERKDLAELFSERNVPPVKPTITPTTESRQIAGWTCIVHNVTATHAVEKLHMVPPVMVTQGTMCLVKNGPGLADYSAFYQALGKSTPFDPSLGVLFAQEITISFKGAESTSELMDAGTYAMEVTSVSTAPIPDSMFEIPADYSVTKR